VGESNSRGSSSLNSRRLTSAEEFPSTIWVRVEQAKQSTAPQSQEALAELCKAYWHPVYAFIRRKGNDPDRAADLTQSFFTVLIETAALSAVTQEKGRFRAFLMAACTHFLCNQRVHDRALKRGGGRFHVSIDQLKAEDRLSREPFHEMTPEKTFVRQWALTLLDRVMARVQAEAALKGKTHVFEEVRPVILGREAAPSYAQISAKLGMSETTLKVTVHRYRARYRALLRDEIGRTVSDPADVEQEITTLIEALAS
jgi:DNA-directed RNA polymerase specialized sigma24 family protein